MAKFIRMITTFDTHTGGEPTRIVVNGLPPILGETMAAKKKYMREHLDHFRTLLMGEPREDSPLTFSGVNIIILADNFYLENRQKPKTFFFSNSLNYH